MMSTLTATARHARACCALLLAVAFLGLPSVATAALSLSEISAYLNSFRAAKAGFRQINADGSVSTGTLYIQRPGRARFEYDPPDNGLVIAGGGQVAIFDPVSNRPPEQYPLARTPLKIILARRVDLAHERMVVEMRAGEGTTTVVAQDPGRPEQGRIRLIFSDDPVALSGWVIVNEAGQQTRVMLDELQTGVRLPASLFNIVIETRKRSNR